MSVSATQFVSETFANFLLENANNGVEILSVLDDFNPQHINWDKVLKLEDNETVESYTEDIDNPCVW